METESNNSDQKNENLYSTARYDNRASSFQNQDSGANNSQSRVRFTEAKVKLNLTTGQKLQKLLSLTVTFILDVGIIFLDWFLDFITGLTHFQNGNVAYGILTWSFPIIAGIICSIRLPNLLKRHNDDVSKFCKLLASVPSLQPIVYSYRLFQTKVKDYPGNPANANYLAHLQLVSNHLKILEGIFEAAPQAILQIYICFWEYESNEINGPVIFTVFKVLVSLVSITEVFVKYWLQNTPYIFIPDRNTSSKATQCCDYCINFSKRLLNLLIYPLYITEAFTLACLRAITIVFALLILPEMMASRLHIVIPQPKKLIPILTVVIALTVPRLVFAAIASSRCIFSSPLKKEFHYHQTYCQIRISDLRFEYFIQYLRRGIFSIFVYPLYPCHRFLIYYTYLETALVLSYVEHYGLPCGVYSPNKYNLFALYLSYHFALLSRFLHQRIYLSNPRNRHLVVRQFSKNLAKIVSQLHTGDPNDFTRIKVLISDLESFFNENFLNSEVNSAERNIDIFAALSFQWSSLEPKIGENAKRLVYRHINFWDLPNYCLYRVLVYYCKSYNDVLLRGSANNSPVDKDSHFKNHILESILDTVKPLAKILISISDDKTHHFQHFSNFEFPVGMEKLGISEVTYIELRCFIRLLTAAGTSQAQNDSTVENSNLNNIRNVAWSPALEYEIIPFIDDI